MAVPEALDNLLLDHLDRLGPQDRVVRRYHKFLQN